MDMSDEDSCPGVTSGDALEPQDELSVKALEHLELDSPVHSMNLTKVMSDVGMPQGILSESALEQRLLQEKESMKGTLWKLKKGVFGRSWSQKFIYADEDMLLQWTDSTRPKSLTKGAHHGFYLYRSSISIYMTSKAGGFKITDRVDKRVLILATDSYDEFNAWYKFLDRYIKVAVNPFTGERLQLSRTSSAQSSQMSGSRRPSVIQQTISRHGSNATLSRNGSAQSISNSTLSRNNSEMSQHSITRTGSSLAMTMRLGKSSGKR
jgi:hypothetical protein